MSIPVQQASPVFHNAYAMLDQLGFRSSEVGMQVSVGRDVDDVRSWNVIPSEVIDK